MFDLCPDRDQNAKLFTSRLVNQSECGPKFSAPASRRPRASLSCVREAKLDPKMGPWASVLKDTSNPATLLRLIAAAEILSVAGLLAKGALTEHELQ